MNVEKHRLLAAEAVKLKTAWACAVVLAGYGKQITAADSNVPNYTLWTTKALKRHLDDLQSDFERVLKHLVLDYSITKLRGSANWFASQFTAWKQAGLGVFEIGRVHEVEAVLGRLRCRTFMDCPPYAQVLLQGLHDPAIRHPEYHLGSDLALLFNLLLDAESHSDEAKRRREPHCSEHSQSLARAVILTCFNLLEAFVSGLATAWIIEDSSGKPELIGKFQDKKLSLRRRLVEFPTLITGKVGVIDGTKPPFDPLFRECKQRRDSFVHCEPGPQPTAWGYVKENQFHAADLASAQQTVDLTFEAISQVWRVVHGRERPSWLPKRSPDGRFERVVVRLVPVGTALEPRNQPET